MINRGRTFCVASNMKYIWWVHYNNMRVWSVIDFIQRSFCFHECLLTQFWLFALNISVCTNREHQGNRYLAARNSASPPETFTQQLNTPGTVTILQGATLLCLARNACGGKGILWHKVLFPGQNPNILNSSVRLSVWIDFAKGEPNYNPILSRKSVILITLH